VIYLAVSEITDCLPAGRKFSVSGVLKKLGVSRSGYYDWLKRKPSNQAIQREFVKENIKKIYDDNYRIYGAPKITKELNGKGISVAERTVTKYMREMKIRACYITPYTVTTISEDFTSKLQNLLRRNFNPERPNAVWCTDITYIYTEEGFIYLSCIMDIFSRKIVAWELSNTLETVHVINAIRKALYKTSGVIPRIIHTDRGVQYTSDAYIRETSGMQRSYSGKGNPWDNACIESFHALIKREWLNRFRIKNFNHAYKLIFEYIDTYYNTRRIHSHCDYKSPEQYERDYYRLKESLFDIAV
jgi:transposase InsO family protein